MKTYASTLSFDPIHFDNPFPFVAFFISWGQTQKMSIWVITRARKVAQFLHSNEPKCLGPGFECLSNPMIFHTKHIWSKVKEQKFLLIYLGCPLQLSETKHEFNCAQKELNYVYEKIFWRGWQRGLPTNTCVNR